MADEHLIVVLHQLLYGHLNFCFDLSAAQVDNLMNFKPCISIVSSDYMDDLICHHMVFILYRTVITPRHW